MAYNEWRTAESATVMVAKGTTAQATRKLYPYTARVRMTLKSRSMKFQQSETVEREGGRRRTHDNRQADGTHYAGEVGDRMTPDKSQYLQRMECSDSTCTSSFRHQCHELWMDIKETHDFNVKLSMLMEEQNYDWNIREERQVSVQQEEDHVLCQFKPPHNFHLEGKC